MRLIHCADLHLDSRMNTHLDKEKAKERKRELLATYEHMVSYASGHGVSAILIVGDLFDTASVSAMTRNTVLNSIRSHPDIHFYYLKGNHDSDSFLADPERIPENLFLFSDRWRTYSEADGAITISGAEFKKNMSSGIYHSLILDEKRFNIVMLHGQEALSENYDDTEIIPLHTLKNRNIDYLALGHIHSYKSYPLDDRGTCCYSGCLEGRGFDECGEHGFVLLDIDEESGTCIHTFVPFAGRRLYTVKVDVSDSENTTDMVNRTAEALWTAGCEESSLVKVVLTGTLDVCTEKDPIYIWHRLKDYYYFLNISDETSLKININDYLLDESLKGEFVRLVMADDSYTEEDQMHIIRAGLQALAGEEVS